MTTTTSLASMYTSDRLIDRSRLIETSRGVIRSQSSIHPLIHRSIDPSIHPFIHPWGIKIKLNKSDSLTHSIYSGMDGMGWGV
jgi:hypothetical protein